MATANPGTVNFDDLQAIIARMQGAAKAFGVETDAYGRQQEIALNDSATRNTAIGDANATVVSEEQRIKQQRQDAMEKVARDLQVDQNSAELSALNQRLVDVQGKARDVSAHLSELNATSPADDILGWIGNQIAIPFVKEEAAAKHAEAKQLADQLQERYVLTQQNAATLKAISEGSSAARTAALMRRESETAALAANQNLVQAAAAGMNRISLVNAMNMEQVKLAQSAYAADVQKAHLQLSMNADARDGARLAMQREQQTWAREQKQKEVAKSEDFMRRINTATQLLTPGAPIINERDLANMSKKQTDMLVDLASTVSYETNKQGEMEAKLNSTPIQLRSFFQETGKAPPANYRETFDRVTELEAKFIQTFDDNANAKGGPKFAVYMRENPAGARALLEKAFEDKLSADRKLILAGDPINTFSVPAFATLVKNSAFLQANPIVQKMAAFTTDGNYKVRPEDALQAATEAYGVTGASLRLAKFYDNLAQATYETKGLKTMSIPALTKFPIQMRLNPKDASSRVETFDALSPIAWERFQLMRQEALANAREASRGFNLSNARMGNTQ